MKASEVAATYRPYLVQAAARQGAGADAEDLAQDALLAVISKGVELDPKQGPKAYLHNALFFATTKNWRKHKRRAASAIRFDPKPVIGDEDNVSFELSDGDGLEPEQTANLALKLKRLGKAASTLNPLHRSVWLLWTLIQLEAPDSEPLGEVSEMLGISKECASTRMHRANKQLGDALSEEEDS